MSSRDNALTEFCELCDYIEASTLTRLILHNPELLPQVRDVIEQLEEALAKRCLADENASRHNAEDVVNLRAWSYSLRRRYMERPHDEALYDLQEYLDDLADRLDASLRGLIPE